MIDLHDTKSGAVSGADFQYGPIRQIEESDGEDHDGKSEKDSLQAFHIPYIR